MLINGVDVEIKPEANLRWADLRGANLRGANLSRANLSDANLRWADLRGANLRGANLRLADLSRANLSDANLRWADLRGAYLSDANLRLADLSRANLSDANLRWADLRDANLRWADLRGADLRGANLSGANIDGAKMPPIRTPEGDLVVYKKVTACGIVKLRVPSEARRTASWVGTKLRAEYAVVMEGAGHSMLPHDAPAILYEPGLTVRPHAYDDDPRVECAPGIHFFLTREEAEAFGG